MITWEPFSHVNAVVHAEPQQQSARRVSYCGVLRGGLQKQRGALHVRGELHGAGAALPQPGHVLGFQVRASWLDPRFRIRIWCAPLLRQHFQYSTGHLVAIDTVPDEGTHLKHVHTLATPQHVMVSLRNWHQTQTDPYRNLQPSVMQKFLSFCQQANGCALTSVAWAPAGEPTESSSPPLTPTHRAVSAEDLSPASRRRTSRTESQADDSSSGSRFEDSTWQ